MVRTLTAALAAPALILAVGCSSQTTEAPPQGEKPATGPTVSVGEATQASHVVASPTSAQDAPSTGSSTGSAAPPATKTVSAEAQVARGAELSSQGKRREAAAAYTAALKQNPQLLPALLYRAGEHYALQDFEAAEKDLAQALTIDSNYAEAYILRAHLWGVKHDYQKAVEDFLTALQHPEREANFAQYFGDKKDVVAHVYLAAAYAECPELEFRDDEKAFQHALKACELDGWKNRRYVYLLVSAIAGSKTQDAAARRQETAVAAAPDENIKQQLQGATEAFERRSEFPLR